MVSRGRKGGYWLQLFLVVFYGGVAVEGLMGFENESLIFNLIGSETSP